MLEKDLQQNLSLQQLSPGQTVHGQGVIQATQPSVIQSPQMQAVQVSSALLFSLMFGPSLFVPHVSSFLPVLGGLLTQCRTGGGEQRDGKRPSGSSTAGIV